MKSFKLFCEDADLNERTPIRPTIQHPKIKNLRIPNPRYKTTQRKRKNQRSADVYREDATTTALQKKADKSGMPVGILRKVYNRGVAAWRTGHRPGTNPTQWGHARVNSFATKSKGTWGGADKDLAAKVRG